MSNNEKNITNGGFGKLITDFIFIYVVVIAIVLFLKTIPQISNFIKDIEPFIAPGITIFIFLYTTSETRKIQEENKEESRKLHEENKLESRKLHERNRKNDIRPHVFLDFKKNYFIVRHGRVDPADFNLMLSQDVFDIAIEPNEYAVFFDLDNNNYEDTKYLETRNIGFINEILRIRNYSGKDIVAKDVKLKLKVSGDQIKETLTKFGYTVTKNSENVDYLTYDLSKGKDKIKFILKEEIFNDKVCFYLCGGQYVTVDLYQAVYSYINRPLICLIYGYVKFVEDSETTNNNMFMKILEIKAEFSYTDVDNNLISPKEATLEFKISYSKNEEVRIDYDIIES